MLLKLIQVAIRECVCVRARVHVRAYVRAWVRVFGGVAVNIKEPILKEIFKKRSLDIEMQKSLLVRGLGVK